MNFNLVNDTHPSCVILEWFNQMSFDLVVSFTLAYGLF